MRHENHGLDITNVDWLEAGDAPAKPTLVLHYADPPARLSEQLSTPENGQVDADRIDVTFRLQSPVSETAPTGVLGVSNNVTGDFILEVPTDAARVQDIVYAARRCAAMTDHDTTYTLEFQTRDGIVAAYEKRVFLVYGPDGTLLRPHSLIPNGIEI